MGVSLNLTVSKVAGSASIENNTSKVKIVLKATTTLDSYNESGDTTGYIELDGAKIADLKGKKLYLQSTTTLYSATKTVQHEEDGSKRVTVKASFDTKISAGVLTQTKALTLDTIPRAASLVVPVFTLGKQETIGINSVGDFDNEISYRFGSVSGSVMTRSDAEEVMWTPPLSLAEEIPAAGSGKGTLTVKTYSGETLIGTKDFSFTANVPEELGPVISAFVPEPVSDNQTVSGWGVLVKNKSRLGYRYSAEGQYGAEITKAEVSFAGLTGGSETPLLTQAGIFTPQLTVTDSRGKTATATAEDMEVYDYYAPVLTASNAYRSDSTGKEDESGAYIAVTAAADHAKVGGENALTLRARYRKVNGAWGGYTALDSQQINVLAGIAIDAAYEVEISAVDSVGESKTVVYAIPTAETAFHIREGGRGAAFGKYAEEDDMLDIAWGTLKVGGKTLLDWTHPVGSLYWSKVATDPGTLFGGTWVQVKDVFILAAGDTYAADGTGGEAEVKLTAEQLPKLSGAVNFRAWGSGSPYAGATGIITNIGEIAETANGFATGTTEDGYRQLKISFGGDEAHSNMPPYLTRYCWERIA